VTSRPGREGERLPDTDYSPAISRRTRNAALLPTISNAPGAGAPVPHDEAETDSSSSDKATTCARTVMAGSDIIGFELDQHARSVGVSHEQAHVPGRPRHRSSEQDLRVMTGGQVGGLVGHRGRQQLGRHALQGRVRHHDPPVLGPRTHPVHARRRRVDHPD